MTMKFSLPLLLLPVLAHSAPCPFSATTNEVPEDGIHRHLRRRLSSLVGEGKMKRELKALIKKRQIEMEGGNTTRNLIQTECMTQATYDDIQDDIAQMAAIIQENSGDGELGHFIGGIVRLAAHDFMDFDRNPDEGAEFGGSDGCLDFSHPANAGLPDLWCDDEDACPLKHLYDTTYSSTISKADFWVIAANAAIAETAVEDLNLPFRFGRVDSDSCPNSSIRLPEPGGCSDIEATFIGRMGVSWRDATALMGAHTLGRGDENASGHVGTWVQSDLASTIFDNGFYRETVNRGWRPRTTPVGTDWTWGGNTRGVMMLNTDICLRFDIPDGDEQDCCTNINQPNHCRDDSLPQCPSSETVRPEAFAAFEEFNSGGRNNTPFYNAFSSAWVKATENGYDEGSLHNLVNTCDPTPVPSTSPPTTSSAPSEATPCNDIEGTFSTRNGDRDCAWVIRKMKCDKFGETFCPDSCELC